MYDPNLFPRMLYGDLKSTREAWRKIARRAWKAGDWGQLFARDGMVPLSDFPSDIVLERSFFGAGVRGKQPLWRLYWSSKSIRFGYSEWPAGTSESVHRASRLMLGGMEHLWFTVGLLCFEGADLHDPIDSAESVRTYYYELLKGFVNWLPEILSLRGLFSTETFASSQSQFQPPNWWAANVLRCITWAGYKVPQFEDEQFIWTSFVEEQYGGQVVEWFLELGIIRADGNRFAVTGRPS